MWSLAAVKKRRPQAGSPAGTLAAHPREAPAKVHAFSYGDDGCDEHGVTDVSELVALRQRPRHLWVDVQGVDDVRMVAALGRLFDVHPLALADAVNTPQRPKAETFGDQLLVVTQMASLDAKVGLVLEQLTIVVGKGFVLTFQDEDKGDVLDPVRARLRTLDSPVRQGGPDYLAYAIIDTVIDGYYPVLEGLGEALEKIENDVVEQPLPPVLKRIQTSKRLLLNLRRALWPHRDAVAALARGDSALMGEAVRLHLRDCYDHSVQLIDALENYRDVASSLLDAYVSSVSNRMNEIIKVLTIISTIFMPLSFVAGVYGMNFEHMPELTSPVGYPAVLGLMGVIAGGMLLFFKRKGWLGAIWGRRQR
jgi:magnesium transporter